MEGLDLGTVGVSFNGVRVRLGRDPMKLLARIGAPFAWKVVRQHDGYTYFENSITGQRRCHWTGSLWGHITSSCDRAMSLMGRSGVRSIRIYFGATV
jgi:hypothetical protein